MKRIGIFANAQKARAPDAVRRLAAAAEQAGLETVCIGDTRQLLPTAPHCPTVEADPSLDVVMALGGDGTVLAATRFLAGADVPVLGINLGSLGFLASVPEPDLEEAVACLAADDFAISTRTMAVCEHLRGDECLARHQALNDLVLGWGTSTRVISLELVVNEAAAASYLCDGMILSTPTGSTGHSLSAGGPILHPETQALLINVICPHTLSTRPLVLPDTSTIAVTLLDIPEEKNLLLSVDGQQGESFLKGDRLVVKKHPTGLKFIELPGYSYFKVLQQKLHWRGKNV